MIDARPRNEDGKMSVNGIPTPADIAVSGLRAEARRVAVIASNIANARTTRTDSGRPYRRRNVVLSTSMDGLNGVTIQQVVDDLSTDFKRVRLPGHPDADENGWVLMPNVELPVEMMNLVMASRAYQANVAVLKRYQEIVEVTMELLR